MCGPRALQKETATSPAAPAAAGTVPEAARTRGRGRCPLTDTLRSLRRRLPGPAPLHSLPPATPQPPRPGGGGPGGPSGSCGYSHSQRFRGGRGSGDALWPGCTRAAATERTVSGLRTPHSHDCYRAAPPGTDCGSERPARPALTTRASTWPARRRRRQEGARSGRGGR